MFSNISITKSFSCYLKYDSCCCRTKEKWLARFSTVFFAPVSTKDSHKNLVPRWLTPPLLLCFLWIQTGSISHHYHPLAGLPRGPVDPTLAVALLPWEMPSSILSTLALHVMRSAYAQRNGTPVGPLHMSLYSVSHCPCYHQQLFLCALTT